MNIKLALWGICNAVLISFASENKDVSMYPKVGVFSCQNQEEIQENFFYYGDVDDGKLCAVYGGHGGPQVAKFLAESFPLYFKHSTGSMNKRMVQAFECADKDEYIQCNKESGSTAAMIFIKDNIIHCAHVGDSRALLERNGKVDFVTVDHTPYRADEYIRIEEINPLLFHSSSHKILPISRTFGHYNQDKRIAIALPEYEERLLSENHKFVVLATCGLWDYVSNEDVAAIVHSNCVHIKNTSAMAKLLALFAVSRGLRDNITIMVVDLLS